MATYHLKIAVMFVLGFMVLNAVVSAKSEENDVSLEERTPNAWSHSSSQGTLQSPRSSSQDNFRTPGLSRSNSMSNSHNPSMSSTITTNQAMGTNAHYYDNDAANTRHHEHDDGDCQSYRKVCGGKKRQSAENGCLSACRNERASTFVGGHCHYHEGLCCCERPKTSTNGPRRQSSLNGGQNHRNGIGGGNQEYQTQGGPAQHQHHNHAGHNDEFDEEHDEDDEPDEEGYDQHFFN